MKNLFALALTALLLLAAACDPNTNKTAANGFLMPEVDDVVMYQVNPRVFAPQNSLKAVTARLDSIADLGVNVIWIMPIYPIGEEKSKNSPYSVKNYTAIAPEFGTIDDLKALVDSCHRRGIGVILDWVANHSAWDNEWLKQHPEWYTQDSLGNIIYPPGTDWTDVADFNYGNADMRRAMREAMLFWVDSVGIDGFRCDVADQVPADFWKGCIDSLRTKAQPRKLLMLAEGNNPDNFAAGFDMNYAWSFMGAIAQVFERDTTVKVLYATDSAERAVMPEGKQKMRFTTNHDESTKKTPPALYGNLRGSMAAFVATTMLHGGMMLYGSQEVGYPNPISFFQYVPVDWNANPDIRSEYKRLIGIYNAHPALRGKGALKTYDAGDDAMIFERSIGDDRVLVLVNLRNHDVSVNVPEDKQVKQLMDLTTEQPASLGAEVTLKPYEYRLLKVEN